VAFQRRGKLVFTPWLLIWYNYCKMLKILKKYWPLFGAGTLILFVVLHILWAQRGLISRTFSGFGAGEGIRLADIHYSQSDPDAKVTWLLDATEVIFSKDRRFMSFHHFRLQVQPQDRPHVELVGAQGDYDTQTGELVLKGGLKGKTDNGYTFETESAVYNHKKGDLQTQEPVVIMGPLFSIRGRGLSFDVNREILKINSEVTTSVKSGILMS
jgi:LPS export ABC transporter protein LptC